MNLVQLRRLVDAVEQGSLSEAARRGGVSVQAVKPTAFGRMLCSRAAPLLDAFDDLALFAAGPGGGGGPSGPAAGDEETEPHGKDA